MKKRIATAFLILGLAAGGAALAAGSAGHATASAPSMHYDG